VANGDFLIFVLVGFFVLMRVFVLMRRSTRLGTTGIPPVHLVQVPPAGQRLPVIGRNDVLFVLVADMRIQRIETDGDWPVRVLFRARCVADGDLFAAAAGRFVRGKRRC
jgi:hypothetical protein